MEFMALTNERRSVRAYADRPVDQALVAEVIRAAQLAPSWKNSQTGRYYVALDPAAQAKIRACLPPYNQKSSTNAALIVTAYEKGVAGCNGGEPANELGDQWGAYDLGLQNMLLTLRARELGLDTLIMGIRDGAAIRAAANVPDSQAVFAVIALGYRDQDPAAKPRKALEEVLQYID